MSEVKHDPLYCSVDCPHHCGFTNYFPSCVSREYESIISKCEHCGKNIDWSFSLQKTVRVRDDYIGLNET